MSLLRCIEPTVLVFQIAHASWINRLGEVAIGVLLRDLLQAVTDSLIQKVWQSLCNTGRVLGQVGELFGHD